MDLGRQASAVKITQQNLRPLTAPRRQATDQAAKQGDSSLRVPVRVWGSSSRSWRHSYLLPCACRSLSRGWLVWSNSLRLLRLLEAVVATEALL